MDIFGHDEKLYRISYAQMPPDTYEEDRISIRGGQDDLQASLPDIILFGSRVKELTLPVPKVYCSAWPLVEMALGKVPFRAAASTEGSPSSDPRKLSMPPFISDPRQDLVLQNVLPTHSEPLCRQEPVPSSRQTPIRAPIMTVKVGVSTINVWQAAPANYAEACLLIAANDMTEILSKQTSNSLFQKIGKQLGSISNDLIGLNHVTLLTHIVVQRYEKNKAAKNPCLVARDVAFAIGSIVGPFCPSSLTNLQKMAVRDPTAESVSRRLLRNLNAVQDGGCGHDTPVETHRWVL